METNEIDIHSLVTKILYPKETKKMSLKEIKTNLPDLRKKIKAGVFSVITNGNASTVSKAAEIDFKEAQEIYNKCAELLR